MKTVYRTITFWVCVGGFVVNLPLLFIALKLGNTQLQNLHVFSMLAFAVGATSHWFLERMSSETRD